MRARSGHSAAYLIQRASQVRFLAVRGGPVVGLHVRLLVARLLSEAGSRGAELVLTAECRRNRPDSIFGEIDDLLEVHDLSSGFCARLGQVQILWFIFWARECQGIRWRGCQKRHDRDACLEERKPHYEISYY